MPFYWWRRLQTAPMSIKVAVGAAALWGAVTLVGLAYESLHLTENGNPRLLLWVAQLSLCTYVIIGTSRMSLLPTAVLGVALVAVLADAFLTDSFSQVILALCFGFGAFSSFVTPHWRQMSWRPFGEEPPVEPRLEDLFD